MFTAPTTVMVTASVAGFEIAKEAQDMVAAHNDIVIATEAFAN